MNRARQRFAFSLLELIIVVAIVAMLASMALPRFGNATVRYRADAAAHRLMADLTMARKQARQSSGQQKVVFDAAKNTYQLPGIRGLDSRAEDYQVNLAHEPYSATVTSADFAGATEITFNGYGLPVGIEGSAGTVVIQVGSELRTVVLDGDTGGTAVLDVGWMPGDAFDPNSLVGGKNDLPVFDR